MDSTRPDALEALKQEKEWLEERLERVNVAIAALSGDDTKSVQIKRPVLKRRKLQVKRGAVQWASEISKVFEEHNNLRPSEVIDYLSEGGIENLDNADVRKSVYATLNRKVSQGELAKTDGGVYYKSDEKANG